MHMHMCRVSYACAAHVVHVHAHGCVCHVRVVYTLLRALFCAPEYNVVVECMYILIHACMLYRMISRLLPVRIGVSRLQ